MARAVMLSAMIFLIFHYSETLRADPISLRPVPNDHAATMDGVIHTAGDRNVGRGANVQQFFGTAVTADYGWAWSPAWAIPEPASVVLLTIGGVLMFGRFRNEA